MEFILEFFREFREQAQDLPDWVNMWMLFMGAVYLTGLLFIFHQWGARFAVGMLLLLNVPASAVVTDLTGNIDWIAAVHLILWPPVLYYLVTRDVFGPKARSLSPYGIWAIVMSATIAISLAFDSWDTIRLILGTK